MFSSLIAKPKFYRYLKNISRIMPTNLEW